MDKFYYNFLYEKTIKESMVDKNIDEKEAIELKKDLQSLPDKSKEIMNSTKFRVDDIFGDVRDKDSSSPEQVTKLNIFQQKYCEYKHKH